MEQPKGKKPEYWTDKSLPQAMKLMYEQTPEKDRPLKNIAIDFVAQRADPLQLFAWVPFREVCLEIGEIGVDMWMEPKKRYVEEVFCPTCKTSGNVYRGKSNCFCNSCSRFLIE